MPYPSFRGGAHGAALGVGAARRERSAEPHPLSPDSIFPLALYGKLFCCHVSSTRQRVVLYRLYKDAIIKQFSYPTYSACVGISVLDNLLLVHHRDSGVVMLFDIMTTSMQPFVSPLPARFHPGAGGGNLPSLRLWGKRAGPYLKGGRSTGRISRMGRRIATSSNTTNSTMVARDSRNST